MKVNSRLHFGKVTFIIIVLLVFVMVSGCGGGERRAEVTHLTMGTTGAASSHYAYLVAAAQVINEEVSEIQITAVESGAARENADRMKSGEFELGLGDTVTSFVVFNGLEGWEPFTEYRWLWTYTAPPMTYITTEDIESLYDLDGKPFAPAQPGSSAATIIENTFLALGIQPDYYRGSYSDAADAMKNRQIVGYAKPSAGPRTPDAAIMDIMTSIPVKFHSLTQEEVQKVKEQYPYLVELTVEPNVYSNQPNALTALGFAAGVATTTEMSEEIAYKMVKAIVEGKDKQAEVYPAIKDENIPELTLDTATVFLHAGAIRYYKEIGYEIPEDLIPPEYK